MNEKEKEEIIVYFLVKRKVFREVLERVILIENIHWALHQYASIYSGAWLAIYVQYEQSEKDKLRDES